jgi:hypothetical protein
MLLPALAPCVRAQAGSVILYPTADTYVDSSNPNSNYGAKTEVYISKFGLGGTNYEKIPWLKFNLTSIPNIGFVDTATLQLYAIYSTETYNVYAHSCSSNSWTELELTYSNMPPTTVRAWIMK